MSSTSFDPTSSNPNPEVDINEQRLEELRADKSFVAEHGDKLVAISGGLMIAHAPDEDSLAELINKEASSQSVLIAPVDPNRMLNFRFRMPRSEDAEG